jgi:hypothetical protein
MNMSIDVSSAGNPNWAKSWFIECWGYSIAVSFYGLPVRSLDQPRTAVHDKRIPNSNVGISAGPDDFSSPCLSSRLKIESFQPIRLKNRK